MTQLRNKMLEELQRRNYSHRTATAYIRIVREFTEHFHQAPDTDLENRRLSSALVLFGQRDTPQRPDANHRQTSRRPRREHGV